MVEYGHLYHDDELITRPWRPINASAGLFHDPKLMYNYTSVPQKALNGRRTRVEAGATVGGGSTVNGMFLVRGSKEDYDAWEELGNPGWGWSGLLPYFRRSVTFTPPGEWLQEEYGVSYDEAAAYGGKGNIHASNPAWAWPAQKAQMAGWKELGIKQQKEGAGGDAYGVFWVPRAQDPVTETRSYSVSGHLDLALARPNFKLLTGHSVKKVVLNDLNDATGVIVKSRYGGNETTIRARKEVVLAAGLHSPIILQRSGIGPRETLEKAGVPCLIELPGVGNNLQDHPPAGIFFEYATDMTPSPANLTNNATFAAEAQENFNSTRSGPYLWGHNAVAFLTASDISRASRHLAMLEWQAISKKVTLDYLPRAYAKSATLLAGFREQRNLLARALASRKSTQVEIPIAGDSYAMHILQKPLARGSISLNPLDPVNGAPLIDFQTFANPIDLEMMVEAFKFTRKWAATDAMSVLTPIERSPGTDAEEASRARKKIQAIEDEWREKARLKKASKERKVVEDLVRASNLVEKSNGTSGEILINDDQRALQEPSSIAEQNLKSDQEAMDDKLGAAEEHTATSPDNLENDVAPVVDEGVEDERLRIHIRNTAESGIGHESGTCAMMPLELGGVVGPDLLVHGVQRLSVVDASIIPLIPSANLCATVYAIAEKASDLIKERHSFDKTGRKAGELKS